MRIVRPSKGNFMFLAPRQFFNWLQRTQQHHTTYITYVYVHKETYNNQYALPGYGIQGLCLPASNTEKGASLLATLHAHAITKQACVQSHPLDSLKLPSNGSHLHVALIDNSSPLHSHRSLSQNDG